MKNTRVVEYLAAAALVVILAGGSLWTSSATPEALGSPSYEALTPLLSAGEGKGIDDGVQDIFQVHSVHPVMWIWVENDTIDGMGVEYRVIHPSFVHPGPEDDSVEMHFVYVPNYTPADLTSFLAWIVNRSPHVQSAEDLDVHLHTVSTP